MLDALRDMLREHGLIPIVFDFDRPAGRDISETVLTLAGMSYFVIVDVTAPRSAPLELQLTVPSLAIPFVPIIQEGEQPFSMLEDLETKYEWVLPTLEYDSIDNLRTSFERAVLDPARDMSGALMERTGKRPTRRRLDDAPQN